jgi:hypothetical protein
VKRHVVALMLACAVSCTVSMAAEPSPAPEYRILRDGDDVVYHGGEAPLKPGPGWLALDVVGGRWNLLPASLQGEPAYDGVVDGSDDKTGVRLRAAPPHAFLYLLPGLTPGKVDTPDVRFKDQARPMDDSTALALTFNARPWRLDVRQHEIFVTDGSTTMSFGNATVTDDGAPDSVALLWAGDLDRDGRLDFIFEGSGNNDGTLCVWLSSRAAAGQLVGRAACWRTTGC